MEGRNINIKTTDGDFFTLPLEAIQHSVLLRKYVSENKPKRGEEAEYECEKLNTEIFCKIRDYLEHYQGIMPTDIERPLGTRDFRECVNDWDYNYIDVEPEEICRILEAASGLGIYSLVDLGAAKLASLIRDKEQSELEKDLKVPTEEFTEEDIEHMNRLKERCISKY